MYTCITCTVSNIIGIVCTCMHPITGCYLVQAAFKSWTMSKVLDFGLFTNGTNWSPAISNVQSEVACGYLCLSDYACKAFFYNNSTLLCKPEQECRLVTVLAYALWQIEIYRSFTLQCQKSDNIFTSTVKTL